MLLIHDDVMTALEQVPDGSVDLVLTDPPYNIGVTTGGMTRSTHKKNEWDKIDNYIDWCIQWLLLCSRKLKPNGVLYFFHNDIVQVAELMEAIKQRTPYVFASFIVWEKSKDYRALAWHNRDPEKAGSLNSWFNIAEFCLHYYNSPGEGHGHHLTGLERIRSTPECFKPLKDWYRAGGERLGLTNKDIAEKYTAETGKKPHMLGHYFADNQFALPTREVWDKVFVPLGFGSDYNSLIKSYDDLMSEYENMIPYHRCDPMHCNVWHYPMISTNKRLHTCQKPVEMLERIIRVSCPPGGVVLDCFLGSGSTGVAAVNTGRDFIGIEKDEHYFTVAKQRIEAAQEVINNEDKR